MSPLARSVATAVLFLSSASASPVVSDLGFSAISPRQLLANASTPLNSSMAACSLDQNLPPGNLTLCGNSTLFNVFRPRARVAAPEGYMNDPMGIFVRDDGYIHVGYQHHPQHIQWGNISMAAAISKDFATWTDVGPADAPLTLYPSQIYDARGVFDGTIIPAAQGFEGYPTIIYTSTFPGGPLGATSDEKEGTETVSIAYTKDGGASWIKLRFGAGGNPVIYKWPMANLTGFRDPYAFNSPHIASIIDAGSNVTNKSDLFITISGGVHGVGAKLFLYRQAQVGNVVDWDYLGPLVEVANKTSFSPYSGNFGINFETAAVARLNASGAADHDPAGVDVIGFGTEQGRIGHDSHWPLWAATNYTRTANGSVSAKILYAGVVDWGRAYAYVNFPYPGGRQISVGWTYEDDEDLVLAKQQGYNGALTTFRDLYIKKTYNVDPTIPGLRDPSSWGVNTEADGTITVSTVGQKLIPEIVKAFKDASALSYPANATVTPGYTPFAQQPTGRHYAIKGQFDINLNSTAQVGYRVLASADEYTDILYDPVGETLNITRTKSSLIKSYGNDTESARLKLFNFAGVKTKMLSLTIIVDNSVLEVFANDEAVITTRIYPWLSASVGAGVLGVAGTGSPVKVYNQELWDGLLNAFPARKENSSRDLIWDGEIASIFGLWAGN